MQVKPFMLVGVSVLASIQSRLEQAVQRWAAEWGVAPAALTLCVQRAWESDVSLLPLAWSAFSLGRQEVRAGWHPDSAGALQDLMFSPDASLGALEMAQLAPAAGRAARAALAEALLGAALPHAAESAAGEEPARHLFERGAGAIVVSIRIGHQVSCLLLNHACVDALSSPAAGTALPALQPVDYRHAVATTDVLLALGVGRARVGLGQLMTLAVGDVIRLETPLDQALALNLPSGAVLLNGYIGQVGGQVAVELIRQN